MDLKRLKRDFLAAFPVIGPHTWIEGEMMVSGKKPLTWMPVNPDDAQLPDRKWQKWHQDRKLCDHAVAEGKLIAKDIEITRDSHSLTFRHYARPGQEEALERVAKFNQKAFNLQDTSEVDIGQDMGRLLGYRRRDVLFYNHILHSGFLTDSMQNWLIRFNAPVQQAYQEKLLEEAGYDLAAWKKSLPSANPHNE
jgi:hypothetical protein